MSLIRADGVNFSYFGSLEPVFKNLNFTADTSWRTGLIGANGSGKTTLFKLLCGEEKCGGKIISDVPFVRFPFDADPYESVGDVAARCGEAWRLARELSLLGLSKEIRYRPLGTLSGGERTKVMLALLFCADGFPLIDEPTDSLDMRGRERLAEYLRGKQGYIVASHDRAFLDRCTDHTLALSGGGAEVVAGSYCIWKEENEHRIAAAREKKRSLENEAERMTAAAQRTARWAARAEQAKYGIQKSGLKADKGFVSASAARVMKRAKISSDRKIAAAEHAKQLAAMLPQEEKIAFSPQICRKQCIFEISDAEIKAGDAIILRGVSLRVMRGERLAVVGENGCGKSTLLKFIAESLQGEEVSYLSQQCEDVCGTPAQYAAAWGIDEPSFKSMLAKLGFRRTDWDKDMSLLSTGQRKKAALARSLLTKARLYLWDEPFNYLDIPAREMIEDAIIASSPTMAFVEHDAAFVSRAATRIFQI